VRKKEKAKERDKTLYFISFGKMDFERGGEREK
jgi:hypothetical protein